MPVIIILVTSIVVFGVLQRYFYRLLTKYGTALSAADTAANHPCISGVGRCTKPDTKCRKICQGITSLRYDCTLALLPASICCRCAVLRLSSKPILIDDFHGTRNDRTKHRFRREENSIHWGQGNNAPAERRDPGAGPAVRHDRERLSAGTGIRLLGHGSPTRRPPCGRS